MSDIGWSGLAISLLLVGVAIIVSIVRRLGLERSIVWASARAFVQLIAVGIAARSGARARPHGGVGVRVGRGRCSWSRLRP